MTYEYWPMTHVNHPDKFNIIVVVNSDRQRNVLMYMLIGYHS